MAPEQAAVFIQAVGHCHPAQPCTALRSQLRTALKVDDEGWKLWPWSGACERFTCTPQVRPQNRSPLRSFLAAARCCPSIRDAIEPFSVKLCFASLEKVAGSRICSEPGCVQFSTFNHAPRSGRELKKTAAFCERRFVACPEHAEASTLGTFPAITTWQRRATHPERRHSSILRQRQIWSPKVFESENAEDDAFSMHGGIPMLLLRSFRGIQALWPRLEGKHVNLGTSEAPDVNLGI